MLPVIPFDILLPMAVAATAMCLALVIVILARRAFHRWWSRGGARLTRQIEDLLTDAYSGREAPETLVDWFDSAPPVRINSFVEGVQRISLINGEIKEWVGSETEVPERLGDIFLENGRRGMRRRWSRIAAARAIGELEFHSEIPELIRGLDDPDPDVAYAAGSALSRLDRPDGADALLERIGDDTGLNNSRLASFLETMDCDMSELFSKHLKREDSQARFWCATLIGQRQIPELAEEIRPLLESEDPNVRAAACECVGELQVHLTDRWLAPRIHDDMWFVQSHAAKSLGQFRAAWAIPELAELLYSGQWWVRQNTAEALINIGSEVVEEVEKVLLSEDQFARNMAVEILERVGWVEDTVHQAVAGAPGAGDLLHQFGLWGGLGYLENALFNVSDDGIVLLLEILRDLGDDATYGRIRAAAEQMPEELRPHAYSVAAEVQGR